MKGGDARSDDEEISLLPHGCRDQEDWGTIAYREGCLTRLEKWGFNGSYATAAAESSSRGGKGLVAGKGGQSGGLARRRSSKKRCGRWRHSKYAEERCRKGG